MIFRRLEQRTLNKINSIKSITDISDASTQPKILSFKKFDDVDSDAATTYFNIDSISPVQRPKALCSVILIQSKIAKESYTNLESLQSNSPQQNRKEDLNVYLKVVQNSTLSIKICPATSHKTQNDFLRAHAEENKIEDIPFSQLQRISTIDITFQPKMMVYEDHLIMQEIKQIMDYFLGITKISLNMSQCSFESAIVTSSISRMMKDMGFLSDIELNFSGCGIPESFMSDLISEFKNLNLHNLRRLSLILNYNKIETECMLFLSNIFEDMINLSTLKLELQNCSFTNKMLSLLTYHASQLKKLQSLTLNLEKNQLTDEGVYQLCENLFQEDFKLEEFSINLNQNKLTNKSANYLSLFLKSQQNLQQLSLTLRNYKLKSADFVHLGKSLIKMFDLKELNLDFSFNELDDDFSIMLETSFKSLRELKLLKIDLSNNQLFKKGAQFLDQLFKSEQLEVFDINLSNNKIGRGAGYSLALQLFFSANLRVIKLDLSNNGMNGSSITCLLNQLKNNYSLEELFINFTGNNYQRADISALCENLVTNPLLKRFTLIPRNLETKSQLSSAGLNILEETVQQKHTNILSLIAYQQQIAKHLIGDTYTIYSDLYED